MPESTGVFQLLEDNYEGVLARCGENVYRIKLDNEKPFIQYNSLGVNNVQPHIDPTGNLDYDAGSLRYPIGEETSSLFANAPIFIGKTQEGDYNGFFNFYNTYEDFISLPQNTAIQDNKVWKISQKEIDNLQQRLANEENLEPFSNAIFTYPAKGNPNCIINGTFYNIEANLAPFIDVNNDGIYNIFDGDYPEMKGDQMIWFAKKDTLTGLEIHGRWYAYQCGDHIVSNTIYLDYELFNNSNEDLMITSGQSIELDAGNDGEFYTWSTGETTSSIDISLAGNYAVTVIDQMGCEKSDDININLATTNEAVLETDVLIIYPNPVKQGTSAFIQLGTEEQFSNIKLINLVGQELYSQVLHCPSSSSSSSSSIFEMDFVANLPSGIYIIQLSQANGKHKIGKLVIE